MHLLGQFARRHQDQAVLFLLPLIEGNRFGFARQPLGLHRFEQAIDQRDQKRAGFTRARLRETRDVFTFTDPGNALILDFRAFRKTDFIEIGLQNRVQLQFRKFHV